MISLSDEKTAKEKALREEKERLLKQQLTAKRAASVAASVEDDKTSANGEAANMAVVAEDAATAMVVDQTLATPASEMDIASSSEAKVRIIQFFLPSCHNVSFQVQPWLPQLLPLMESAKKILPSKALRVIT